MFINIWVFNLKTIKNYQKDKNKSITIKVLYFFNFISKVNWVFFTILNKISDTNYHVIWN